MWLKKYFSVQVHITLKTNSECLAWRTESPKPFFSSRTKNTNWNKTKQAKLDRCLTIQNICYKYYFSYFLKEIINFRKITLYTNVRGNSYRSLCHFPFFTGLPSLWIWRNSSLFSLAKFCKSRMGYSLSLGVLGIPQRRRTAGNLNATFWVKPSKAETAQ